MATANVLLVFISLLICRLVDIDDFVKRLWQTHLAVKKEGYVQVWRQYELRIPISCGIGPVAWHVPVRLHGPYGSFKLKSIPWTETG